MTVEFCKYDESGRVLFHGQVPESMIEMQGKNVYVGKVDGEKQYFDRGILRNRPQSLAKLNGSTLFNLVTPCDILINGKSYLCNDSVAELELTHVGKYAIKVKCWPYLDAVFEITR